MCEKKKIKLFHLFPVVLLPLVKITNQSQEEALSTVNHAGAPTANMLMAEKLLTVTENLFFPHCHAN